MYNYCTLFNSNYLTRGLAMYESLKKNSDSFHLYIFAFDDRSFVLLNKLCLESVTVISLKLFEDEELLIIKGSRSIGEYCWTCTPSIIKYSLEKYNLDSCTYLDADLYFFLNPSILIEEMGKKSVLITEHRYTPEYDQSDKSGIYCVQFMTFNNNENGLKVLNWWRAACNNWCYARHEEGRFGDQKYLDDWTTRFQGVHVLKNFGGGVAPWNIQQYSLENKKNNIIFYHFHALQFLENNKIDFGLYKLNKSDIELIYKPYLKHLKKISESLNIIDVYNYNGIKQKNKFYWKDPIRRVLRRIRSVYNVYSIDKLLK